MNDVSLTDAEVTNHRKVSMVWITPIIALLIGAWMVYQHVSTQGPEITLIMADASGLEVGKTEIKSLNVSVGVVTAITLNPDYDSVTVSARMSSDAERMLRNDTLFWVAKPRIGAQGVSGLDTILSGSYIEIKPGSSTQPKYDFEVLDAPPVADPDAKGLRVVLTNQLAGKLNVGDPVFYKGLTAGRVEKIDYNTEDELATYQIFIFAPYDELIRTNTKFWLNAGLDVELNSRGFKVQMQSLEGLLRGGVTFGLIDQSEPGLPVTTQFIEYELFEDKADMEQGQIEQYIDYVMFFDESIRGLSEGAAIEYRGLRIGSVAKIPLHSPSMQDESTKIPVLLRIEPTRMFNPKEHHATDEYTQYLVKEFSRGLSGSLKTGSLLTGALYINVDYVKDHEEYQASTYRGYPIFPSAASGLAEFQKQLSDLTEKFGNLPIEQTVNSMNTSLVSLDATLKATEKAMDNVTILLEQRESKSLPEDLRNTLNQIEKTMAGYDPNGPFYRDLDRTMLELKAMMNQLKPVVQTLNEQPNALLFGSDSQADPIPPKGANNE